MKSSISWSSAAKKMVCLGAAGAMLAMCALPFGYVEPAEAASASTSNSVTCASYRAAEPTPEILGISNIASNTAWSSGLGELNWSSPYFYIMGTDYNTNPNPYMVNSVANAKAGSIVSTPCMVYDGYRKGGPTASMEAYSDTNKEVWDMLPDIILGNRSNYDYNSAEFGQAAAAANGVSNYTVEGVAYDSTSIYTMIGSMYNLATAGTKQAAATGKSLRYGDPTEIVQNFEEYVKGTQGYILKKLGNKEKKTVALVSDYDAATGTYTLAATGVEEGTAASNRYLEACQNVATNLGDTTTTCTQDELAKVDLILVGSQSGGENLSDTETIVSSMTTAMQKKCFWVNSANGSAGSCYGVVMNSVENAQNTGRILGCLYPEYIDQSDWIAYYYQNFYHIKTGSISEVIANTMDGVRNWNANGASSAATAWEESDVADYKESTVQTKLDQGMAYIADNASKVSTLLTPTSNYGTVEQVISVSNTSKTYKAKALKKAKKTFTVKATAEGKVTFKKKSSSKLSITKTGKVTVKKGTKKGTYTLKTTATAAKTANLAKATKTVTVKVKVK